MKRWTIFIIAVGVVLAPHFASAYSWMGYKWGVSTVGYDTSALGNATYRSIATTAMNQWNAVGAKFQMVNQTGSSNTIGYYWDNSTVLAYNQLQRKYVLWGDAVKSTIKINNYHRFNPPYSTGEYYDLASILRHELGHTVTLNHSSVRSAVMYSSFDSGEVRGIASDDIQGIKSIYGTR
jgi:predicted Zn-dependent protease